MTPEFELYEGYNIFSSEVEPLDWWNAHEKIFPTLAKLARKYFSFYLLTWSCLGTYDDLGDKFIKSSSIKIWRLY